jgi:WD40 repeat protein
LALCSTAARRPPQVRVFDVETGKELSRIEGLLDPAFWMSFTRDGKFLHYVTSHLNSWGKTLYVADPATGKGVQKWEEWPWNWETSWDGNTIVVSPKFGHPTVYHLNAGTGQFGKGKVFQDSGGVIAPSRDGKWLATGSGRTVNLYEVASEKRLTHHSLHTADVAAVAFSPDSERFASVDKKRNLILWSITRLEKEKSWSLEGLTGESVRLVFAGDGKALATFTREDKAIALWSVPEGKRLATLDMGRKGVHWVWLSPDARRLAARDMTGNVRIWDLRSKP